MIHYNYRINRPENTVLEKKKDRTMVLLNQESVYNKDKKYNSFKRIHIGKLDENNMLIPNDNYFKIFGKENVEIIEKPKEYSDVLSVGHSIVFDHIFTELDLDEPMALTFGSKLSLFKSLIYYYVDSESNNHQGFNKWAFNNLIHQEYIPSESTISNFLIIF